MDSFHSDPADIKPGMFFVIPTFQLALFTYRLLKIMKGMFKSVFMKSEE